MGTIIKPQYIANSIIENGLNLEFKKLEVVVSTFMIEKFTNHSEESILEYAESYTKVIATELFEKENAASEDGVKLNFDIKEEDDGFYIKFIERPEIELLKKLQADTSSNFEKFCSDVLTRLGGNSSTIGGKDDGGIDFIGTDLLLNNLASKSTLGSRIVVIGQAKRYKDGNHVTEKEMREFIGCSIKRMEELKRTRSDSYGIFQPTVLAFWTTSDFHIEARKFAIEMGIWYLNGIALCQLALNLKMS
jgi:restriction endonuclease Mrr